MRLEEEADMVLITIRREIRSNSQFYSKRQHFWRGKEIR